MGESRFSGSGLAPEMGNVNGSVSVRDQAKAGLSANIDFPGYVLAEKII
jgi:hypothetical protein